VEQSLNLASTAALNSCSSCSKTMPEWPSQDRFATGGRFVARGCFGMLQTNLYAAQLAPKNAATRS
jgi:hypothetical protein